MGPTKIGKNMKYVLASLVAATLGISCMCSYAATKKQRCSWDAGNPASRDACHKKSKSFGSKTGSKEDHEAVGLTGGAQ